MVDGIIQLVAGLFVTAIGFRVIRVSKPEAAVAENAWHARWGRYFRMGGPLLMVLGLAQIGVAIVRAPASPAIRAEANELTSEPLGFRLALPEGWVVQPPRAGVDVVAQHPETGGILVASAQVANPPDEDVGVTIEKMIEARRARQGVVDVTRGSMPLGELTAQFAAITIPRGDEQVRAKTILARKGPYVVSLTCNDGTLELSACDALLAAIALPR